MTEGEKELMTIVYHEAGHVLAALVLNMRFKRVSIKKDDISEGRVTFIKEIIRILEKANTETLTLTEKNKIEHDIIIDFSGFFAQKKFTGQADDIAAGPDWANAKEKALSITATERQTQAYLNYLLIVAEELIADEDNWKFIDKFSKMLYDKETIKYKLVKKIYDEFLIERTGASIGVLEELKKPHL